MGMFKRKVIRSEITLDKASFDPKNNIFHDFITFLRIVFCLQVVSKDPGNSLPEEGSKAPFKFLDHLVGGASWK